MLIIKNEFYHNDLNVFYFFICFFCDFIILVRITLWRFGAAVYRTIAAGN